MTCYSDTVLRAPRALIFDLDGTLVDSVRDIACAMNEALVAIGAPSVDAQRIRTWIGDGLPELCRRAAAHVGMRDAWERLLDEARRSYDVHCTRTVELYPNMLKTLDLLTAANIPMCVLSNKPQPFVDRIVTHLNLAARFVACRGYLTEEDKKPAPRAALRLADVMHVAPSDVAVVGDSMVDIDTARNAGMRSIGVTWGIVEGEKKFSTKPDWVIDSPLDLPKIFFAK